MQNPNQSTIRYYLCSLSNFLAAIGGGMILSKGINVIDIPILQGSSLLAFFAGTVFGLVFLKIIPSNFSKILARWFSILGGLTSLVLLYIFLSDSINEKISGNAGVLFFIILSIRFSFWFYSRVLRAASAAGQNQNIAWVELGYYSGIIIGLIVWVFLGVEVSISIALIIDALLQLSAGFIDLFSYRLKSEITTIQRPSNSIRIPQQENNSWIWRLIISVMFLTVGVQVVIFNLSHKVSENFSPYVLAIFYLGAALSAYFCKKVNIRLEWPLNKKIGYATIFFGNSKNKKLISFLLGSILSALGISVIILTVFSVNFYTIYFLLAFVFASTFLYGILELAILDRIGLEEKESSHKGMVLNAYGMMSIAAAISFWILEVTQSAIFELLLLLTLCFLITVLSIRKRVNASS